MATIKSTVSITEMEFFKDIIYLLGELAKNDETTRERLNEIMSHHNYDSYIGNYHIGDGEEGET